MILCEYGCGQESNYQLQNGKMCCSKSYNSCSVARRKNSESNKGKIGYWKGKKQSIEARNKMKKAHTGPKNHMHGRSHTNEVKKLISDLNRGQRCGCENPNWKGGIAAEPYCDAWLDKEYKESIKDRDGYKCLNPVCVDGKYISIHHINYIKKNCKPENLITLCKSCNAKANFEREWHISWYKAIIYRRYLALQKQVGR